MTAVEWLWKALLDSGFEDIEDVEGFYYQALIMEKEQQKQADAKPVLSAGWISVNEKLPEHENNVLAVLDGHVCIMNYFSFEENGKTNMVWGYVYDGINGDGIYDDNYCPTHWMDIPCTPACT